ncbi:MAG: hypothetical protein R3B95_10055 [Nitrospirales bacterium]|nr:hypothetical protein [Nitrospirales bacterium]
MGYFSSIVSRTFTHASAKQLQVLQDRDLRQLDIIAMVPDRKIFADMTMVVAEGITMTGKNHLFWFVETGTKNEQVLTLFLQSSCD